jgi:two-component system chemotaxis sensor kinase CheA
VDNNDQILDEFLLEAGEIFDRLDQDFILLEKTPDDKKLVGNIFRAMHTLKGSSGFFSFRRLEKVAHAGESLLSKVRDGSRTLDLVATDVLLETLDRLREIVKTVETKRSEPEGDDSSLIDRLKVLTDGGTITAAVEKSVPDVASVSVSNVNAGLVNSVGHLSQNADTEILVANSPLQPLALPPEQAESLQGQDVLAAQNAPRATELTPPIKVNVDLLDRLMNLVSEMVLARNRLLSFAQNSSDTNFTSTIRTIDMITMDLQSSMMETRMQPISNVWAKFPRLVRDVAQLCHKKVELVQIGAETELDRTLLESIRDPLIHIIRNSIDHGIELPEDRLSKGKGEVGTVTLSSMHENGMVVITISDDGGGVNLPLVARKALDKGLTTPERISRMADREILDFIYLPGFSTKENITNLSGRGVGMDVVRTNVQQIGGSVDISTSPQGTSLRLRIPLTLAIMPAVFVRCGEQRFAIPQNNLFEMVRYQPSKGKPGLEDFFGVPVFRLRNKLIPVLFLNKELEITPSISEVSEALNIVVVQATDICFGMIVDEVLFIQEVVVKSVGPALNGTTVYSGATILGDGRVAMILDIAGIAVRSGLISKLQENNFKDEDDDLAPLNANTQQALLFDLHQLKNIALHLDYVERLETFPLSRIEHRGQHEVIVYGDKIMRLIWLSEVVLGVGAGHFPRPEKISVVVHYHNDQPVGFVVKCVHDIVCIPSEIIMISPPQRGMVGDCILEDVVVSILDVGQVIRLSEAPSAVIDANTVVI